LPNRRKKKGSRVWPNQSLRSLVAPVAAAPAMSDWRHLPLSYVQKAAGSCEGIPTMYQKERKKQGIFQIEAGLRQNGGNDSKKPLYVRRYQEYKNLIKNLTKIIYKINNFFFYKKRDIYISIS
jgi:hypothetical protein